MAYSVLNKYICIGCGAVLADILSKISFVYRVHARKTCAIQRSSFSTSCAASVVRRSNGIINTTAARRRNISQKCC